MKTRWTRDFETHGNRWIIAHDIRNMYGNSKDKYAVIGRRKGINI
jgi:hypothetical protein